VAESQVFNEKLKYASLEKDQELLMSQEKVKNLEREMIVKEQHYSQMKGQQDTIKTSHFTDLTEKDKKIIKLEHDVEIFKSKIDLGEEDKKFMEKERDQYREKIVELQL